MVTAGTADSDSNVCAIAGGEAGEPFAQITENVLKHLLDVVLGIQVLNDRLIEPGKVAQLSPPIGVGQATDVEDQVGIHRHAAFEPEGLEQKGGAWLGLVQQAQFQGVAQLVKVEVGGIDLQVGLIDDRRQQLFLDRKSTRLNSSHVKISYAVFCLKKKNIVCTFT